MSTVPGEPITEQHSPAVDQRAVLLARYRDESQRPAGTAAMRCTAHGRFVVWVSAPAPSCTVACPPACDCASQGRQWAQLVIPELYAALPDTAATLPAGLAADECEVCGANDAPETLIPVAHAVTGGVLVQAHPECAAARGYVPAGRL